MTWAGRLEPMATPDFADFIDDHIEDIGTPPTKDEKNKEAAERLLSLAKLYGTHYATKEDLIALSKGVRIHSKDEVEQVVDPQSGEVTFNYTSAHTANRGSDRIKIPGLFILQIPVFEKGDVFRLPVRLRYRVNGPSITWSFKIINLDKARDTAIEDMKKLLTEALPISTFFGVP
jgi:hypothetical protein